MCCLEAWSIPPHVYLREFCGGEVVMSQTIHPDYLLCIMYNGPIHICYLLAIWSIIHPSPTQILFELNVDLLTEAFMPCIMAV